MEADVHDRSASEPTTPRTGGQWVVEALRAEGVRVVYTVPGESFLPVLDALFDHRGEIDVVSTRHEAGAGFAAEGHAKATGAVGVCMVTRGVGATNLSIAIHTAHQDATPLVVLVGQVPTTVKYREAFQEVDLVRHYAALAKWAVEVPSAERVPELLQQAFRRARSGRPGPVVVGLPEDVLYARAEARALPSLRIGTGRPAPAVVDRALALLREAERPVVVAGREVVTDRLGPLLATLAERLALPVVNAFRRYDAFPNDHASFVGNLSPGMPDAAWAPVAEADLVLMLGDRFTEFTSRGFRYPRPGTRLVHVAGDDDAPGAWGSPDLAVVGDLRGFLEDLLARVPARGPAVDTDEGVLADRRARLGRYRARRDAFATAEAPTGPGSGGARISAILAALGRRLPADTAIVTDVGNFSMWVPRYVTFTRPGTHVGPISGAMGYALPAAIGVALADRGRRVVVVAGDGGFAMTMAELATLARERLDVLVVVLVNDLYGTIRMHQERTYPGRPIGTDLANPSFAAIAEAHGIEAVRVEDDLAADAALAHLAARPGPALLEVRLGDERIAAWGDQGVGTPAGPDLD